MQMSQALGTRTIQKNDHDAFRKKTRNNSLRLRFFTPRASPPPSTPPSSLAGGSWIRRPGTGGNGCTPRRSGSPGRPRNSDSPVCPETFVDSQHPTQTSVHPANMPPNPNSRARNSTFPGAIVNRPPLLFFPLHRRTSRSAPAPRGRPRGARPVASKTKHRACRCRYRARSNPRTRVVPGRTRSVRGPSRSVGRPGPWAVRSDRSV